MNDASRISAEDAEEYTRALGQIMSGGWRAIALAQRIGVPAAIGMTTEAWVRERIGGYVRLGLDERREAIKELTDPEGEFHLSQRQAAEVLGIGKDTVRRDLMGGADAPLDAHTLERDCDDGGADAPPEAASPYREDEDGRWTLHGRPWCEGCSTCHDDDDLCPRTGAGPTVGDVMSEIADELEASGAFERVEAEQQARRARSVRLTLLEIVSTYPPGVLAEGLDWDEIGQLVADLDALLAWTETAKRITQQARRPRRVEA